MGVFRSVFDLMVMNDDDAWFVCADVLSLGIDDDRAAAAAIGFVDESKGRGPSTHTRIASFVIFFSSLVVEGIVAYSFMYDLVLDWVYCSCVCVCTCARACASCACLCGV